MKISIVEDDNRTAETLESYIKKYFSQIGTAVDVAQFPDAVSFLDRFEADVDVVFMDVEMPGLNGMEAVRELRKKQAGAEVVVIFVTNLAQYAVSGYEVSAFDFIVKPVSYGLFAMKLGRLCRYFAANRKREICVSTRHGKTVIRASDIRYVEIMRHVVTYHTENGNVVGSGTLKNVIEQLDGLPFELCNRCYLVNLQYVTRIAGNEAVVGGESLQISAPRRKEFLNKFNQFLGAGGKIK